MAMGQVADAARHPHRAQGAGVRCDLTGPLSRPRGHGVVGVELQDRRVAGKLLGDAAKCRPGGEVDGGRIGLAGGDDPVPGCVDALR